MQLTTYLTPASSNNSMLVAAPKSPTQRFSIISSIDMLIGYEGIEGGSGIWICSRRIEVEVVGKVVTLADVVFG